MTNYLFLPTVTALLIYTGLGLLRARRRIGGVLVGLGMVLPFAWWVTG